VGGESAVDEQFLPAKPLGQAAGRCVFFVALNNLRVEFDHIGQAMFSSARLAEDDLPIIGAVPQVHPVMPRGMPDALVDIGRWTGVLPVLLVWFAALTCRRRPMVDRCCALPSAKALTAKNVVTTSCSLKHGARQPLRGAIPAGNRSRRLFFAGFPGGNNARQ
jgi:hypothetical protein